MKRNFEMEGANGDPVRVLMNIVLVFRVLIGRRLLAELWPMIG